MNDCTNFSQASKLGEMCRGGLIPIQGTLTLSAQNERLDHTPRQ